MGGTANLFQELTEAFAKGLIKNSDDMAKFLAKRGAKPSALKGLWKAGAGTASGGIKNLGAGLLRNHPLKTLGAGYVGYDYLTGGPLTGMFNTAQESLSSVQESIAQLREQIDPQGNGFFGNSLSFIEDNIGACATAFASLVGWGISSRIPLVGSYLSTPLMLLTLGMTAYLGYQGYQQCTGRAHENDQDSGNARDKIIPKHEQNTKTVSAPEPSPGGT